MGAPKFGKVICQEHAELLRMLSYYRSDVDYFVTEFIWACVLHICLRNNPNVEGCVKTKRLCQSPYVTTPRRLGRNASGETTRQRANTASPLTTPGQSLGN